MQIKEDLQDIASEDSCVSLKSIDTNSNVLSRITASPTFKPKYEGQNLLVPPTKLKKTSYVNVSSKIEPIFYSDELYIYCMGVGFTKIRASINSKMLILHNIEDQKYPLEYYYIHYNAEYKISNNVMYYPLVLTSNKAFSICLYTTNKESQEKWLKLINKATSRIILEHKYLLGDVIGSGSYGVVHFAKNKFTDSPVAIKIIRKKDIKHEAQLKKEIDILKLCKHPNIVKLFEVIDAPHSIAIVMEYLSGGSLEDAIDIPFSSAKIRDIMDSLTSALYYLRGLGIIHRDIKNENIIFTRHQSYADVKLVDFGLTSICYPGIKLKGAAGTALYISPELVQNKKYDYKTDIWSLGVVFYSLLAGRLPFDDDRHLLSAIVHTEPDYKQILRERGLDAVDLVSRMLTKNPKERISIEDVRGHSYFGKKHKHMDSLLEFKMFSSSMHNLH